MKASRWEILGAWLRIWTPPRDVEIPPFPRRAVAVLAVLVVIGIGVWFAVIAPPIDHAKQRDADREAADSAAFRRTERARLVRDQRPRTGRSARAARLYASGSERAARTTLLTALEASVLRDARARVAAGDFDTPVREVNCRVRRSDPLPLVRAGCFAITTRTSKVLVGQSFLAAGSLRDGRYAWCHENPGAGEGALGKGVRVALSRACLGS